MAFQTVDEVVGSEVRELIRRRGVDPLTEPARVSELIDEVLGDYADRALSSPLPPIDDPSALAKRLHDGVAGFGPLQALLDDPEVEEVWINQPGRIFAARKGVSELTTVVLTPQQLEQLVERMLRTSGRRLDLSSPFVDALMPDGSRLHVVIPDVTRRHMAVNIRKFVVRAHHLHELVALGTLTGQAAAFLDAAMVAGLNLIVAGGTQAGKTTLLNCLCASIPARERVITVEEVFELRIALPDVVAMQTRQASLEGTGEISLRRLVKEALRMRPSRIVVGEVRQDEALDMLIALNSGVPGAGSVHANSAREAIQKLCTLPLLAGENISSAFVVPTVATAIDIVVHLRNEASGQRRVREIVALSGRTEGSMVEMTDIFHTVDGQLIRGEGYPPHLDRFERAGIDIRALLTGGGARHAESESLPATQMGRP